MNLPSCSARRLALAFLCLAALPFVQASKQHPVIGLSIDAFVEERWQRDRDTFVAAVKSLGGSVVVQSANMDAAKQAAQIQDMIQRKVDVLVIVPQSASALSEAIQAANAANIPVVSYDRLITGSAISYYLSFDNVKVGEVQAHYLAARLPADRPAKIIRVYGSPSDNNAKLFKEGQDRVLEPLIKAGKVKVLAEGWADKWRPEAGRKIVADALDAGEKEVDGILCSNDGLAGGAVEALTAKGIAPEKLIITGQDADLPACARIRTGTQSMTVYKPVQKLAKLGAKLAFDLAQGIPPTTTTSINNGAKDVPAVYEDVIAVDKDNLATTVLADGFHRKG